MNPADVYFFRWLLESIGGLILIGFGLSLFGHAVILKAKDAPLKKWFWWGTLSLVAVNAGVSIFADGVRQREAYNAAIEASRKN